MNRDDINEPRRKAAILRSLSIGVPAAAKEYGYSTSNLTRWREVARGHAWLRRRIAAATRLAERIGYFAAADALQYSRTAVSRWIADACVPPVKVRETAKRECVECGELMDKPGLCSEECRQGWIESGGEA